MASGIQERCSADARTACHRSVPLRFSSTIWWLTRNRSSSGLSERISRTRVLLPDAGGPITITNGGLTFRELAGIRNDSFPSATNRAYRQPDGTQTVARRLAEKERDV